MDSITRWRCGWCVNWRRRQFGRVVVCCAAWSAVGWLAAASAELSGSADETIAQEQNSSTVETIRERLPDGRVKIEREVTVDANGNYVNHGLWRMWDDNGGLRAEGHYDMGQRTGTWTRWWDRAEAPLLGAAPFDKFDEPFTSHATFAADKLQGTWIIRDAHDRPCSRIELDRGHRSGTATLWQADGAVFSEAKFENGAPIGELQERVAGTLQAVAVFVEGRQLVNKVEFYPESKVKRFEASCLETITVEKASDDFWELRFAAYETRLDPLRHGICRTWHSNGQLESEGYFQYGREVGVFAWWHAHGQLAAKGEYRDGSPDGTWTWWHGNGQKAAEGRYELGRRVGDWRLWETSGRLARSASAESTQFSGIDDSLPSSHPRPPVWIGRSDATLPAR